MRGYGQFCPIAKGAEIFAERWVPLILREMLDGSHRFGELRRGIPLISQSLLAQRLRSLERDGVIEARRTPDGRGSEYHLTPAGKALRPVVEALGDWGHQWTFEQLREEDFDPEVLMWFLHRLVDVDTLPERRVVVRFEFHEGRHRLWWLILHRPGVDLCLRDEGFEVDLYVSTRAGARRHDARPPRPARDDRRRADRRGRPPGPGARLPRMDRAVAMAGARHG